MIRVAGHFGELLQGRLGPEGPVVLVTLPCAALGVRAAHRPGPGLALHGAGAPLLAPARARAFLAALRAPLRGQVVLRAEMPPGGGAGASTAALVALAHLAGVRDPGRIARAALALEGASDPLMLPAPGRWLWASRQGRALALLPPLPAFDVLGGFAGPPRRTDPADHDFPDIAPLLPGWPGDLAGLAARASASARATAAHRGLDLRALEAVARRTGAAGIAIAHTGSARALLFAPGAAPADAAARLRAAGLAGVLAFRVRP